MRKPNRVLIKVRIRIRFNPTLRGSLICVGWSVLILLASHPGSLPVHLVI